MASRRTIKRALLFIPLLAFVLADCIPYYSARLSLMLHGLPFARVVPKENRDPFQWVKTDSFASKGIVFSGRQAVGWICQPAGSFASYVPFSAQPSLTRLGNSTFRFNVPGRRGGGWCQCKLSPCFYGCAAEKRPFDIQGDDI
jgi:hypothetical protein